MFRKIILIVGGVFSLSVQAGGWTGHKDVVKIGVRGDTSAGFYFMLEGTPDNPDSCGLTDHYFIRNTNPMIKEMYSLVLAAKKSGVKITAKLDGCDNGRPKVISIIE